jgi:hypothetical protein
MAAYHLLIASVLAAASPDAAPPAEPPAAPAAASADAKAAAAQPRSKRSASEILKDVKTQAQPVDDGLAFLYDRRELDSDGSKPAEWDVPGGAQLRMSLAFLEERNRLFAEADTAGRDLLAVVTRFYKSPQERPVREVRDDLLKMGRALEPVREALRGAIDQEQKRVQWLQKGIQAAGGPVGGLDPELLKRRATAIASGKANEAIEARVRGHQALISGLVAYIDGDPLTALEKMKGATRDAPDIALAHAYLGSLYYLFNQPALALTEWRRTLELDPTDQSVRQALQLHAGEVR